MWVENINCAHCGNTTIWTHKVMSCSYSCSIQCEYVHKEIRGLSVYDLIWWFLFCLSAVVFVIDSCHRDRLMESHSELAKLLTEKELRDALLLIFANKQVRVKSWGFSFAVTLYFYVLSFVSWFEGWINCIFPTLLSFVRIIIHKL